MHRPANSNNNNHDFLATAEALEIIRARELMEMTDERAAHLIKSLTAFGTPWRDRPGWSGLVEQQAIFHGLSRT